jgi:hypothetical protein
MSITRPLYAIEHSSKNVFIFSSEKPRVYGSGMRVGRGSEIATRTRTRLTRGYKAEGIPETHVHP